MVSQISKLNPFSPALAIQAPPPKQPINPIVAVGRQPFAGTEGGLVAFAGSAQKTNYTGINESMNGKPVNTPFQAGIPAGVAGAKINLVG